MDWISVKDRLPEMGVPVLVCRLVLGDPVISVDWMGLDGVWCLEYGLPVTHWMPMLDPPVPPKSPKRKED